MRRERKQRELDELMGRTRSLERDNEALRKTLSSRDDEILALNAEVERLSGRGGATTDGSGAGPSGNGGAQSKQEAPPLEAGGDGGGGQGAGAVALPQQQAAGAVAVVAVAAVPGQPLPSSGQQGMPGLVVGVDGQVGPLVVTPKQPRSGPVEGTER
jgi:hypothetical protein